MCSSSMELVMFVTGGIILKKNSFVSFTLLTSITFLWAALIFFGSMKYPLMYISPMPDKTGNLLESMYSTPFGSISSL